jgi:hypothetical protein
MSPETEMLAAALRQCTDAELAVFEERMLMFACSSHAGAARLARAVWDVCDSEESRRTRQRQLDLATIAVIEAEMRPPPEIPVQLASIPPWAEASRPDDPE